jgi:hypothetical protein
MARLQGETGRFTEGDIVRAMVAEVTLGQTHPLAQEMLTNLNKRLSSARGFALRGVPEWQAAAAFPGIFAIGGQPAKQKSLQSIADEIFGEQ